MLTLWDGSHQSRHVGRAMTITIPVWLIWMLGAIVVIPLIGFIGFLAIIGWQMSKVFSK